jgi:hypothetical protein
MDDAAPGDDGTMDATVIGAPMYGGPCPGGGCWEDATSVQDDAPGGGDAGVVYCAHKAGQVQACTGADVLVCGPAFPFCAYAAILAGFGCCTTKFGTDCVGLPPPPPPWPVPDGGWGYAACGDGVADGGGGGDGQGD